MKYEKEERIEWAREIWREAQLPQDTIVEQYLRSRGINGDIPSSIRFHPRIWYKGKRQHLPAMIARIVDVRGKFCGIQRTYLKQNGRGKARVKPAKASLGIVRGGAIRLAKAGETLALAEGIETALSFEQLTGTPTWAVTGASFFPSVELPALPKARIVILAVDNDDASIENAERAAIRFVGEGRKVKFARPKLGNDFNDTLLEGTDVQTK